MLNGSQCERSFLFHYTDYILRLNCFLLVANFHFDFTFSLARLIAEQK